MRLYSDPGNAPTTLIASSYPKIRRVNFTHLYQKLQIFSKYFTLTERNRPKKDPSGKKRLKKQLLRWKRGREMVWNSIRKGRLHGWRGCRYVWVDDSGSVTRHHSISSPVRRVEASPLPCLASEGARVVSAWPSKEWPILVDTSPISLENYADERPNSLIRSPRNTLIEPRLSNGRIEWFGHESHSVSYTGKGTPFSNKFFKISFHRIDSCLILRSLTFNWIDVGNIVFKVFCKSGLRSDESR